MANDEKKVDSIITKLMKRQQELAADSSPEAAADDANAGSVKNTASAAQGTYGPAAGAEPVASAPYGEEAAAEQASGADAVTDYSELMEDVLSYAEEQSDADAAAAAGTGEFCQEYFGTDVAVPASSGHTEESAESVAEDDILMAALGYTDAAEAPAVAEPKPRRQEKKEPTDMTLALAYRGREYKSRSQRGEILRDYDREQTVFTARAIGTGLLLLACIVFDLFGTRFTGPLSILNFPVVHIMISLQLLVLCAALSAKQIWAGLRGIVAAKPVGSSVTATVVILTVLYDIVTAIVCKPGDVITLYQSPAALCLAIQVLADGLRLFYEKRNFTAFSTYEGVCCLEPEGEGVYRLKRGRFAAGYFRHTNRYHEAFNVANYVIAPVCAMAVILFIISLACGRGMLGALNTFIVAAQLAMPIFAVAALDIPFYILNFSMEDAASVILHENETASYGKVEKIVFDETDMFGEKSLRIDTFRSIGSDPNLFGHLTDVSAICEKVGGTISRAFRSSSFAGMADTEGYGDAIALNLVTEGGIDACIGKNRYILGSAEFLNRNGIPCRGCDDEEYAAATPGGTVFHIAVNKNEVFRVYILYTPLHDFSETVRGLSENGIDIELRCLDPNLSQAFVANAVGDPDLNMKVVRREDLAEAPEAGDRAGIVDSGLVADGREWMAVIETADICRNYRRVSSFNRKVLLGITAVFVLLAAVLCAAGTAIGMSPVYLLLADIAALIPSVLLSRLL